VDIKTVSISQKDMDFFFDEAATTEKVCAAFGVPQFMIGRSKEVNYQNSVSLISNFAENTITPGEEAFAETITRSLLPVIGYENAILKFNPQNIDEESSLEARALQELQMGILSPYQYKQKTRQDITPEEENDPMYRKHIVFNGIGAKLLEDIGVDQTLDYSGDADA